MNLSRFIVFLKCFCDNFKDYWYIWLIIVWFSAGCGYGLYNLVKEKQRKYSFNDSILNNKGTEDNITYVIVYSPDSEYHYFSNCHKIIKIDSCIFYNRKKAKELGFYECSECSDNKEFIEKYGDSYRKEKEQELLEKIMPKDHYPHVGNSRIDL